jgi:type II secretion system protein D
MRRTTTAKVSMARCAQWVAGSLVAAALAEGVRGQQPRPGGPAGPGATPEAGVVTTTTQPTTGPTTGPAARLSLNFKDAPLDTVLDYLSQQAGFAVIKDGPVEGRVTIQSKQPVSAEEAVTLVNAALKVNGFTMIREEQRLLRVVAREKAKKGNVPVRFGNKPDEIAATDELITQVIPLANVSATKLKDDLKPLIAPDADVASNDASNTLVVTDTSSNIRRLVRIINAMDQQDGAALEIRTIPLKYANAAQAVKLIETFFKNAGGGGPQLTPQQQQMMMQQGQPVPPPRPGGDRRGQTVVAASDDRTNTLIVQASSGTLKTVEDLVKRLDSNPVPASEMKSFPLKFAQAEATSKLINNLYKAPKSDTSDYPFFYRRFSDESSGSTKGPQVNAQFDERTNTLIVTAPVDVMKAIDETVKMLDASPMTSADLRVFQLKYADAWTVSKLIEDVFKPKDDSGPRFPFYIFSDGPSPERKGGAKVNVTSDDRTNSLIVSAPTELLAVIEGMVQKLDANPATEDTMFIYHLRNGQAQNLEYVLNVLFGNVSAPNQNNAQDGQIQATNADGSQRRRSINNDGNGSDRTGGSTSFTGGRNNAANRRNARGQNGMPRLAPGMAKAVNELTGKVFVVAEPDTNALLVTTASKYKKQVQAIIDDLDRPVPQVLIKVLVAEVKHDNSADLGVDFSILNRRENGRGQTIGQTFGAPGTGLVVSILEQNLTATLHALAEEDKLDVLSRPYILASDNQLANILIGQSVPFVNDTRITDTGQQINNIVYRDIGLSLNVTPHINPDGVVIMDVVPELSQLTSQTVPISSTTFAPVIAKRSAESRIGVKDGQTIVIGGLMEDRKTTAIDKVPLLGDIPLLGLIFSRQQVTKTKTELLIFLTPHVAQRPETLEPMSEDETRGTKLTPKAVAPGTFQEHMDGLQRGRSPATRPAEPISPINSIDLNTAPEAGPTSGESVVPPRRRADEPPPPPPSTEQPGKE